MRLTDEQRLRVEYNRGRCEGFKVVWEMVKRGAIHFPNKETINVVLTQKEYDYIKKEAGG